MGDTTSATVETLTAEVRTLMVGSRQVTLSVAKQLDVVDIRSLEPFGRVAISLDRRLGHPTAGTVIGRDRSDGSLALAALVHSHIDRWATDEQERDHQSHKAAVEAALRLPLIVLAGLR